MPSRRAQTWVTAGALPSLSRKPGWAVVARSTNRRTAADCGQQVFGGGSGRAGGQARATRAAGRSRRRCPAPPGWWRGCAAWGRPAAASRPAGRRRRPGARSCPGPAAATWAAGRPSASAAGGRSGSSPRPSTPATACGDQVGVGQRGELDEPDAVGEVVEGSAATWRARRDLPHRPCPSASAGADGFSPRRASPISRSRPTKLVSWPGRLCWKASSDRGGGKSAGRSGWTSWKISCGWVRSLSRCRPSERRERRAAARPRPELGGGLGHEGLPAVGGARAGGRRG